MTDNAKIAKLLRDRETIERVMRESAQRAIQEHRAAGVPLVSQQGGRVVLIDPQTLQELSEDEVARWLSEDR